MRKEEIKIQLLILTFVKSMKHVFLCPMVIEMGINGFAKGHKYKTTEHIFLKQLQCFHVTFWRYFAKMKTVA